MAVFKPSWLLYGATGYSGRLIAQAAKARGHNVVLAGRNQAQLAKLGDSLGVAHRCFDMGARDAIDKGLTGVRLVLNCAGPFSLTAATLSQACMRTGAHYLDISGEIGDHRSLQRMHDRAVEAGVMLLPGVGFGILPSDCLAVHLKEKQPTAVSLTLAFSSAGSISRGSRTTLMESLQQSGYVRRAGQLIAAEPGTESRPIHFGPGKEQRALLFPWRADALAAGLSTDIAHIQTFAAAPLLMRMVLKNRKVFAEGFGNTLLRRYVGGSASGPSAAQRAKNKTWIYGEVVNEVGARLRAVVEGPDAYDFTVIAALAAVEHSLASGVPEGYATPGQLLGSAPLRTLPGVRLHELGNAA